MYNAFQRNLGGFFYPYLYGITFGITLKTIGMNSFKTLFTLLGMSFVFFSLSNCGSSTAVSETTGSSEKPFKLINSYYQDWVAGVQGGGSGTNIHLRFETMEPGVELVDVYFRNNSASLTRKMTSAIAYIGQIKKQENRPDIIMDGDISQEAQNRPPKMLPLEIPDTHAAFRYSYQGKTYVHVIENIEEKEMLAYPSSNPKGDN